MKKSIGWISVSTLAVLLAGCGGYGKSAGAPPAKSQSSAPAATATSSASSPAASPSASGSASGAAEPHFTFSVSAHAPADDLSSQVIKYWGDEVTQKTHGAIQFRYSWAGSLVSVAQAFDALKQGTVPIADVATSFITGEVPATSVLSVPYAFPLMSSHAISFYNAVNPILDTIYQQKGNQRVLFTDTGQLPVAVISRKGFYTSLPSFHNALIRTAGSWQAKTMQAWGAKPVVIGLGDLYTALQRGTVDSSLLDLELIKSFKIYEVAKYLTNLNSSINYDTLDIGLSQWNKLSPSEQQIMIQAGKDAERYGYQLSQKQSQTIVAELEKNGLQVKTPPQSVINALRNKVQTDIWPQLKKVEGPNGDKIMQVVQQNQKYVLETH